MQLVPTGLSSVRSRILFQVLATEVADEDTEEGVVTSGTLHTLNMEGRVLGQADKYVIMAMEARPALRRQREEADTAEGGRGKRQRRHSCG